MADPFMNEETEKLIRSYGVSKVTKDYKDILNDKDIDAVLVCSSTDTHAAISIEAINAGKHVFCEKPVDTQSKNPSRRRRFKGASGY